MALRFASPTPPNTYAARAARPHTPSPPPPPLTSAAGLCAAAARRPQVKTQLQLDSRLKGPIDAAAVTVRERGFFGLYRGLSSLLIGSIPKAAVRFSAYEQCRKMLLDENGKLSAGRSFLAGLGAGITEAVVVVCPMETIKVKLINDQMKPNPQYKGLVHGIRTIVAQEGAPGGLIRNVAVVRGRR